jgi:hypothetical protein
MEGAAAAAAGVWYLFHHRLVRPRLCGSERHGDGDGLQPHVGDVYVCGGQSNTWLALDNTIVRSQQDHCKTY